MSYPIYIFFGLAPSIIWLLFFLRTDSHPESNRMILKIFFCGMLSAVPVALIELGFYEKIHSINLPLILIQLFHVFLGIALVEELFKYLVVKKQVLKDPEFDEPVDAMLYMIIAALGFAALENLLYLSQYFLFHEIFLVSSLRFVGATFLHALCSGLLGYFLALSVLESKKRFKLLSQGLAIVVLLHGLYNFSIMEIDGGFKFIIPIVILIGLAVSVFLGFKKVKRLKSICKIKTI